MSGPVTDPFGLAGASLDGKYDVECVVAEGGFGVVYRGVHCGLRRPVAIKVLKTPASLDLALRGQFLDKFAQEARLIADLDHPAIVRVLDFGAGPMPCGGTAPWMVLEWLDGVSLESELDARRGAGGRSPAEALGLLRPAFEALAVAHDAGVAHRDLKPANLMLTRTRRGEPALRVLDFGIAKVMREDDREGASGRTATQSRLQAFSLPYAAPEQVSGTRTGPWTDVHALGLILIELLTDAPPYPSEELTELYAAVLSPSRPSPARHGVDVGPWEQVLARALSFRPSDRFQHAGEFLDALGAMVPERAPPPDAPEAITTPRVRPAPQPRTTLRPAEVNSQVAARKTRTTTLAVGATAGLLLALVAAVSAMSGVRSSPAAVASVAATPRPTASPAPEGPRATSPAPPAGAVLAELPADAGVARSPAPLPRARAAAARPVVRSRSARGPSFAEAPPPAPEPRATPRYIPAE